MSADLTCPTCKGEWEATTPRGFPCPYCDDGRRRPELHEWDALKAERDRYRQALSLIADMVDGHHERAYQAAYDALDG